MIPTRYRFLLGAALVCALLYGSLSAQSSVAAPAVLESSAAKTASRWAKDMAAFAAADRVTPPPAAPIVFTGSSSIRRWDDLAKDFPHDRVLNRGFGGSQFSDIRTHFEELILQYHPRQVVIYSGGNDINAKKPVDEVFADMKAIVDRIHRELPQTRVVVVAVALNPKRWEQREEVIALNKKMADYLSRDSRDAFADVVPSMLQADGTPKPDIFVADRLHMNRKGYELWIPVIKPLLAQP